MRNDSKTLLWKAKSRTSRWHSFRGAVIISRTDIAVEEELAFLIYVSGITLGEVVRALNALGVMLRYQISILQALKTLVALKAELQILRRIYNYFGNTLSREDLQKNSIKDPDYTDVASVHREVANEIESLFVYQLLKIMREIVDTISVETKALRMTRIRVFLIWKYQSFYLSYRTASCNR
jgi:hypothetical protein